MVVPPAPALRAATSRQLRINAVLLSQSAPLSGDRGVAPLDQDPAYRLDPGRTRSGDR